MKKQWLVSVVATMIVLVSSALLVEPGSAQTPNDVQFPEPTGPYKVGRTSFEWVDQSRDETLASIGGLKRDLMVYIWFPASIGKHTKIAPYMDGDLQWDVWTGFPGLENHIHTHAYQTIYLDSAKPSYPVLIFTPDVFSGNSLNYASILEEIASHGYIVIGTSHPYSTTVIGYPDGRLVLSRPDGKGNSVDAGVDSDVVKIWTQDIRFVLDQAEKLNTSDSDFKGHLDLSRVGVLGHFTGAWASIEIAGTDTRVKAGASLAGVLPASVGNKPFLYVGVDRAYGAPSQSQLTSDKYWLTIDEAGQLNYGDFGLLQPLMPGRSNPYRVMGTIDPVRSVQIVDSYLLAFFDHYLNGAKLKWSCFKEAHLVDAESFAVTPTDSASASGSNASC